MKVHSNNSAPRALMSTFTMLTILVSFVSCAPIPHYDTLVGRMHGNVVAASGAPVAGARVEYVFRGRRKLGETTTHADGSFELGPFRQWFYLTYIGSPGVAPFPYTLERPPCFPDALRVSHVGATAIYILGSQQDFDSRTDEYTREMVVLPPTPRWATDDLKLLITPGMRDSRLPEMAIPAKPVPWGTKRQ